MKKKILAFLMAGTLCFSTFNAVNYTVHASEEGVTESEQALDADTDADALMEVLEEVPEVPDMQAIEDPDAEETKDESIYDIEDASVQEIPAEDTETAEEGSGSDLQVLEETGYDEEVVGASTIPEGAYNLYAILGGRNCYMSLAGGTTADGGNIQTTALSDSNALKFRFEYVDGYYRIISIKTGYAVTEAGGNVQQNTWQGRSGQQWSLIKRGAAYRIRNRASGNYINVEGGKSKYTTNIDVIAAGNTTTEAQVKWYLAGTGTNVASCSVYVPDQKYTGKPVVPEPVVRFNGDDLVEGEDYTVRCTNNVEIGTASMTITGIGDYTGTKSVSFRITTLLSGVKLTGVNTAYRYTGKAIKPVPKLVMNGTALVRDKDYSVSYSNNLKAGTGRVTATGIGNYGGTVYRDFYIVNSVKNVSEEDTYYIVMHDNPNAALYSSGISNNSYIELAARRTTETEKFRVEKNTDGTYKLIAARSELVIASAQNKKSAGNPVVLYQDTGKSAQHWNIVQNSDDSFSFKNPALGLSLGTNTPGGYANTGSGTILRACTTKNVTSQKFWLIKGKGIDTSLKGRYSVSSTANSSYCLHVGSSSKENNANIQMQKYSGLSAQKYDLVYAGSGYYRIVNVNSGKVLGTASASNGANVRQEVWTGSKDQRWSIIKGSDGSYKLRNMEKAYLSVVSKKIANGRNVAAYTAPSVNPQDWKLVPRA